MKHRLASKVSPSVSTQVSRVELSSNRSPIELYICLITASLLFLVCLT
ncbi:MAG: sortase B protein-sorting domain-containing protein [Candidatus Melainabacteria bacterium]|nr:sortase B protein-sorting domain-containing protein [Candidatus Melainabacteria bacterium]